MPLFEIWQEGYMATDEHGRALFHGEIYDKTFLDACSRWASNTRNPSLLRIKDGRAFYWGCEMFDNEADARKAFG